MPKLRSPWSLGALLKKKSAEQQAQAAAGAPHVPHSAPSQGSSGASVGSLGSAGSGGSGKKGRQEQQERSFLCPIMEKIMQDPCLALDGYTYERRAIEEWFRRGHRVSPVTYGPIGSVVIIPNEKLREVIEAFVEKKGGRGKDAGIAFNEYMVRAAVTKTEERMRQYLRNPPVPPSASSASASASAYSSSLASGATAGTRSIQDTSSRMASTNCSASVGSAAIATPHSASSASYASSSAASASSSSSSSEVTTPYSAASSRTSSSGATSSSSGSSGSSSCASSSEAKSPKQAFTPGSVSSSKSGRRSLFAALRGSPKKEQQPASPAQPASPMVAEQPQQPSSQRTAGSAPSVDAVRLWLEMRTTLAPEDAERYSAAFVEDGATSLDLLVNAGYNKEDLLRLGVKKPHVATVLGAIQAYFDLSIASLPPSPAQPGESGRLRDTHSTVQPDDSHARFSASPTRPAASEHPEPLQTPASAASASGRWFGGAFRGGAGQRSPAPSVASSHRSSQEQAQAPAQTQQSPAPSVASSAAASRRSSQQQQQLPTPQQSPASSLPSVHSHHSAPATKGMIGSSTSSPASSVASRRGSALVDQQQAAQQMLMQHEDSVDQSAQAPEPQKEPEPEHIVVEEAPSPAAPALPLTATDILSAASTASAGSGSGSGSGSGRRNSNAPPAHLPSFSPSIRQLNLTPQHGSPAILARAGSVASSMAHTAFSPGGGVMGMSLALGNGRAAASAPLSLYLVSPKPQSFPKHQHQHQHGGNGNCNGGVHFSETLEEEEEVELAEEDDAAPVGQIWLWLSAHTSLTGADVDRIVEVFAEEGADTMEYLIDAEYSEDDLAGLGIKRGRESHEILRAIDKYRDFYAAAPTVLPTPGGGGHERSHAHQVAISHACHALPDDFKEDHRHAAGHEDPARAASLFSRGKAGDAGVVAGVATEQLVRHYPPVFIPPTPQSTRSRLKHFLAHLPKTARLGRGELQSPATQKNAAVVAQSAVVQQLIDVLSRVSKHEDFKAGHLLLDAIGCGVPAFYAYDEDLVKREETAQDMGKILTAILHAFKKNGRVAKSALEALTRLLRPTDDERRDVLWRRQCGEAGMCTVLPLVCDLHAEDSRIVELALAVIGSLAMERENKRALGLKGGCEAVVRMLSLPQHHRHQHVGSNGLRAVAHLAAEFEANCRRLEAAGAAREVCLTMRRFASLRAANYHGCQAIMHLCRTEGNRHALGREGACQAAFHAIAHFMVQPEGEKGHKHHRCGEELEAIDKEEDDEKANEAADQKIVLMGVWAMIALASASDENKRLLNKIDSKSLLERCLKTTPLSQGFLLSKIKIALERLTTKLIILQEHERVGGVAMKIHRAPGTGPS